MNINNQKSFFGVKNAGFTLIELLVVVLIIGILSAVALPQYQKAVVKARITEAKVNLKTLGEATQLYILEYGEVPASVNDLSVTVAVSKNYTYELCGCTGAGAKPGCAVCAHPLKEGLPMVATETPDKDPVNPYYGIFAAIKDNAPVTDPALCSDYGGVVRIDKANGKYCDL